MKKDLRSDITVVIITKDRIDSLQRTLKQLTSLPERVSIIVVDNASTDGTSEMVKKQFPEVTVITSKKNLGATGRNVGVKKAKTPLIAFADDDSWWTSGSLAKAVQYFKEYPKLGLLEAKILVRGERIDPTCQEMAKSPLTSSEKLPGPSILGFLACGAIIRKKAFLAVGGFGNHFKGEVAGEETLLAIDLAAKGWGLSYVSDVTAVHYPSPTRNRNRRKRLGTRNYLWFLWLRRPAKSAFQETGRLVRKMVSDRVVFVGVCEGIIGLPGVLRRRNVIPDRVENQLKLLNYFTL